MLEIAAELKREGARLKRSVLFTFFTGEERGKFGSKYFVWHPPVDPKSIVADLNVDVVHAIVPLKQVAAIGLDESDLGEAAQRAARSQNLTADAERESHPYPSAFDGNSDQGSFALAGIPAIKLMVGFPGEMGALIEKYRKTV